MTTRFLENFIKKHPQDSQNGREACGKLAGTVGIVCNLLLSVMKLVVGTLTNSVAITADATNNISDAGSSVITLVGFRLSGKPADRDHPYGHARMEYISGLVVSFLILLIGAEILKSSVKKIFSPEESVFSIAAVIVLAVSVLVKLWMAYFNKKLGKLINSTALEATSADSRNDAVSTLAVLIASIISKLTGFDLDGYMGAAVAVFILISGVMLVKETIDPLLGQAPPKEIYDMIRDRILSYDNVLGVHDLMVHSYGPGCYFASAHVEMDAKINVLVCHDITDRIERDMLKEHNVHLVVHLAPTVLDSEETNELKSLVAGIIKDFDPEITFHDFRVVYGKEHKNVVFDVVVPPSYKYSDDEVSNALKKKIRELKNGDIYAVILVDHSYGDLED